MWCIDRFETRRVELDFSSSSQASREVTHRYRTTCDALRGGEAFDGKDDLLGSYTVKGELDSAFYFSQHFQVFRDVFQNAHDPKAQKGTEQMKTLREARAKNYGNEPQEGGIGVAPRKALVNFLDNHDVSRFLFEGQNDLAALRNALTVLMTEEGIPCLYYGTEQDFAGGNDPANREVLWNTGFATSGDTFRHYAKLARLRKGYAALRRGDTTVRWSTTTPAPRTTRACSPSSAPAATRARTTRSWS